MTDPEAIEEALKGVRALSEVGARRLNDTTALMQMVAELCLELPENHPVRVKAAELVAVTLISVITDKTTLLQAGAQIQAIGQTLQ